MDGIRVRPVAQEDLDEVGRMCHSLWPEESAAWHSREIGSIIAGNAPGSLPSIVFIAEREGLIVGFLKAGLRSHADGCDPVHPVGYIEGWYVAPEHRRSGVGARLVAAAEGWARTLGCTEMASDTWIDSDESQQAHSALGYEVVDRCVHYRKVL